MIGGPTGFEAAFQEFVFYAGPIIQLTYWVVLIVAALWAVTLFKRWVDFQTGAGTAVPEEPADAEAPSASAAASSAEKPISVDEFVE